ncbi:hypothetical protein BC831DRAFT_452155 [Entophlyctis helioformis]|nr:hypothetical protein BC831DRAFT_452155 [Entophlyctis helioformis]
MALPIPTYLLLLMSPHLGILSEDQLWKAYTGFAIAAAERFKIQRVHLDYALQHLMQPFAIGAVPDVKGLLSGDLAPLGVIPPSVLSKLEMILEDYQVLGFTLSPAARSAQLVAALYRNDMDRVHQIYEEAHTYKLAKKQKRAASVEAPASLEHEADDSLGEQQAPPPADTPSAVPREDRGLTLNGYNAAIAAQVRAVYTASISSIPSSIANISQPPSSNPAAHGSTDASSADEGQFRITIDPKKAPVAKSSAWRIMTDVRDAKLEPSRGTFEMWLYLFGRLLEPTAVKKVVLKLRSQHVAMRQETLHAALDAVAEARMPEPMFKLLVDLFIKKSRFDVDRQLLITSAKYWIGRKNYNEAWAVVSRFGKKIKHDHQSASLLALAGLLQHPENAFETAKTLGADLEQTLARGNRFMSPKTWEMLIQSYGLYAPAAKGHVCAVKAYHTLYDKLVPAWRKQRVYGLSGESGPYILETATARSVAYACGRQMDVDTTMTLFERVFSDQQSVAGMESRVDGRADDLIQEFMSGWLDADGSVDDLRTHVLAIRKIEADLLVPKAAEATSGTVQ